MAKSTNDSHQAETISVSVIICTLNEAKNLPFVLQGIPSWISEVILVDGYSADSTVEIARQLLPSVRILQQPGKGKGNAIIHGSNSANGEIIIILDADGSMDPGELHRFVTTIMQGYDICKGSRFLKGGRTEDMPMYRAFGNWCFTVLTNLLYGSRYTDLTYGYLGYRRDAWLLIRPKSQGFTIETEILIRAKKKGLKVIEIPSYERKRLSGKGNLRSFRDGSKILWTILRERFS